MRKSKRLFLMLMISMSIFICITFVSAGTSAQGYTFNSLGSGYNQWLSNSFTNSNGMLFSKFRATQTVSTSLTIEPFTSKYGGQSAGKVVITNPSSSSYAIRQHIYASLGQSYWIKVKNSGNTVSGNYNIISSDVYQN